MLILTIRTDKPEAEIGLYNNEERLAYEVWPAHRQLAETIHQKIAKILSVKGQAFEKAGENSKLEHILKFQGQALKDVSGIVCFAGPGSFTGLRIGLTVGNALSYGLSVPIVASKGNDWIIQGIQRLVNGENDDIALPDYGAPPHITEPKK